MRDGPVYDRYLDRVLAGDRAGATRIALEQLDAGVRVQDLLADLVTASQLEVGRRWQTNECSVAGEHLATSVNEHVVAVVAERADVDLDPHRGTVIVTCVEGEWHSLPARLLSEVLRLAGWHVVYLGASTPAMHLGAFLHDEEVDAVALSCSVPTALAHARHMIQVSRESGIPVLAGGRGFGPDGRWALRLGANAWAPDATEAVRVLGGEGWPAVTSPAPPLGLDHNDHVQIALRRVDLVEQAMGLLTERFPPMASYDEAKLERTREDFGYILDFLAAAVMVEDPGLFEEFVAWLRVVLESRGVPRQALTASLDVLADVLRASGPDLSVAVGLLTARG